MDKYFALVEIIEVRENAEERLADIYSDYFPGQSPPKLSNGLVRTVLTEAIELGILARPFSEDQP
jgi:hypothetical protein